MSIWKRALFWGKVKDTLAIGGLLTQGGFELANASEELRLWVLAGNVIALLVGMWMEDKDRDGLVDIFQTEVTTKVTSSSPVDIEVTKKETKE